MERWRLNLAVLWIGQFLTLSGMTMIIPFLSLYLKDELGIQDPHALAWWASVIYAGTFLTGFIVQPIWGNLADRYGRKIMLIRSGLGIAIILFLMGIVTDAWQLLILRILNGVVGGFIPASTALMSASTPRERMGFAMGTLQSGGMAGAILGPFMGGLLAEWIGYRPIFFITGGLMLLASVLVWWIVHESFDRNVGKKNTNISLAQSFRQLMQIKQIPALYGVSAGIQIAFNSSLVLIPLFVSELHGAVLLAFFAGLVGSVTGFSNMVSSPLLGKWSDRHGHVKVLIICLLGAALSFIPQFFVDNVWQLLICRFILGWFMGGLAPTVNALLRNYTPNGMESRAFGFNSSAFSLGNMIGPLSGGALAGVIGIRGIFLFASVLLLINALWAWLSLTESGQSRVRRKREE